MGERTIFIIDWNYNEFNSTLKKLGKFDFYKFYYYVIGLICAENPKFAQFYTDEDEKTRIMLWKRINYDAYDFALKYHNKDLPDWKIKTEQTYQHLIESLVPKLIQLINRDFQKIVIPYFKDTGYEIFERKLIDEKEGENALLIINYMR